MTDLPIPIYSIESVEAKTSNWDWNRLIWGKIEKNVFNLQKRLYKATRKGQLSKAKSLAKLLLRCSGSILLNVRKITQENSGKRTAGVDGITFLTPSERMKLATKLMKLAREGWSHYKTRAIRRVLIPKSFNRYRPLGIPTKCDAVVQGIAKTAMEPFFEAKFDGTAHGFRPGFSAHDAIGAIFSNINRQQKWVLEGDISGCYDNLDQEFILAQIEDSIGRRLIKQWMKASVVANGTTIYPDKGTPQGGVISPLLANIALSGMEGYLKECITSKYGKKEAQKVKVVRYADDFVIMHSEFSVIEDCQGWLTGWLMIRGVSLSEQKTKITHTTNGFDFLGFNVQHYPKITKGYLARRDKGKPKWNKDFVTLIKPSKEAISEHKYKLGQVIDKMRGVSQEVLIKGINPKIQGWANYYRHVVSKQVFSGLDHWLWHKLFRWSVRRHQNKGRRWVVKKYFRTIGKRTLCFASKNTILKQYKDTKIVRHALIPKGKSIYDGDEWYWGTRLSKGYGDITKSKAILLKKQNGKCTHCGRKFRDGDKMETHHRIPKASGGNDSYPNLILLHKHCHDQYHAMHLKAKKERNRQKRLKHNAKFRPMSVGEVMSIEEQLEKEDKSIRNETNQSFFDFLSQVFHQEESELCYA